jgi:hypothetical protein
MPYLSQALDQQCQELTSTREHGQVGVLGRSLLRVQSLLPPNPESRLLPLVLRPNHLGSWWVLLRRDIPHQWRYKIYRLNLSKAATGYFSAGVQVPDDGQLRPNSLVEVQEIKVSSVPIRE